MDATTGNAPAKPATSPSPSGPPVVIDEKAKTVITFARSGSREFQDPASGNIFTCGIPYQVNKETADRLSAAYPGDFVVETSGAKSK